MDHHLVTLVEGSRYTTADRGGFLARSTRKVRPDARASAATRRPPPVAHPTGFREPEPGPVVGEAHVGQVGPGAFGQLGVEGTPLRTGKSIQLPSSATHELNDAPTIR